MIEAGIEADKRTWEHLGWNLKTRKLWDGKRNVSWDWIKDESLALWIG